METNLIARICHEANRAICEANRDYSQVDWNDAEDWQKDSAIRGVQFVLDSPDVTVEDLHNNWCRDKVRDGWEYGEVKDAVRKTHPCLVAYQKLPTEQQLKDKVFRGIVNLLKGI